MKCGWNKESGGGSYCIIEILLLILLQNIRVLFRNTKSCDSFKFKIMADWCLSKPQTYLIRLEILITCSHRDFHRRASDSHTISLHRPEHWMQLVLHYSCGLADLTLMQLYILPSAIEIFYFFFNVYATGHILWEHKRSTMELFVCVGQTFLTGLPASVYRCRISICIPQVSPASQFRSDMQMNLNEAAYVFSELGTQRTLAAAGLDRGAECVMTTC